MYQESYLNEISIFDAKCPETAYTKDLSSNRKNSHTVDWMDNILLSESFDNILLNDFSKNNQQIILESAQDNNQSIIQSNNQSQEIFGQNFETSSLLLMEKDNSQKPQRPSTNIDPQPIVQKTTASVIKNSSPIALANTTQTGCKCKTSNCLRLHCSCFQANGKCSPECRCQGCLNNDQYEDVRQFVIQKTKQIYANAFESKFVEVKGENFLKEGCNCKHDCNNNYCGCKKGGLNCSSFCRCPACINQKVKLTAEEVRKYFSTMTRRKDKIIINFTQEQLAEHGQSNVLFQVYKNKNHSFSQRQRRWIKKESKPTYNIFLNDWDK